MAGPAVIPNLAGRQPKNTRAAVEEFLSLHPMKPAVSPPGPANGRRPLAKPVGGAVRRTSSVDVAQPNVTGANSWWTYRSDTIPGVGKYLLNLASQNLLLEAADDMTEKFRGVDYAFRRTYNSNSGHDYVSSDGSSEIGQYGNGWTNTFDAHISTNNCPSSGYTFSGFTGFSVYDVDGARYDYCYNAAGTLVPPAGLEGTSLTTVDGSSFFLTKKDGTTYTFYAPYYSGTSAAISGRLYRISGRNSNNYLQFTYAWAPDASSSANLTSITVTQDNGLVPTVLNFADFNGQRLLASMVRHDGNTVTYGYDPSGNLVSVSKPGNSSASTLTEAYGGYQTGLWAASPRWEASGGTDGGYVTFSYARGSTTSINAVQRFGVMNIAPADGTGTRIQPSAPTGAVAYSLMSVDNSSPEYTTVVDSDGRQAYYYLDGFGRKSGAQQYTGSQWLQLGWRWDLHNNQIAEIDERGNETDFAYDANDNVIAVAAPQTTNAQGTFRPTKLMDYDQYNNVLAYCDEAETHQAGADWTTTPPASDTLCSSHAAGIAPYTTLQYVHPSYEIDGELTTITAPGGYARHYGYAASQQGGNLDYGLPASVTGDPITQPDGSNVTPAQSFWWGSNGRLRCSSNGQGLSVTESDKNGRTILSADPDDTSANANSLCGKSSGQPGWNTQTTYTYYNDGNMASSQTPAERTAGVSTTFAYDQDGDLVSQTTHHGCIANQTCTAGTTLSWYDGNDRLVETKNPLDAGSPSDFPWMMRYLYDLSQGAGSTTLNGTHVTAYGKLFEIQKSTPTGFTDVQFAAYDGADRITTMYQFAPCPSGSSAGPVYCANSPYTTNYSWDAGAQTLGLLASATDGLSESKSYAYDPTGQLTVVQYTGGTANTPALQYSYDAAGRVVTANTSGVGTLTNTYAADGTVRTTQEPSLVGSGLRTYTYNGDGSLAQLDIADPLVTQSQMFQYEYRSDGLLTNERFGLNGATMAYTYTDAGRLTGITNPGSGAGRTQSYATNGLLSAYTIPAGSYSNLSYDAEANLVGFSGYGGEAVANTYNARGELTGESFNPNPVMNGFSSWPAFQYQSVQGHLVQSTGEQWDGRTGAPLLLGQAFAYDAIGRLTQFSSGIHGKTFSYDAENRLTFGSTDQVFASGNCGRGRTIQGVRAGGSSTYSYGPDGNIVRSLDNTVDGSQTTNNWHWSAKTLLYRDTNNTPGLMNADNIGVLPPNGGSPGLTVLDREPNGQLVSRHNQTGHASWLAPNPFLQKCVEQNPVPASSGYTDPSPNVLPVSPNIIDDGSNTIDPSGSNAWVAGGISRLTPSSSASAPYGASVYDVIERDPDCDSGWFNISTNECLKYIGHTHSHTPECPGCTNGPLQTVLSKLPKICLPSDFATISYTKSKIVRLGPIPIPIVLGGQVEVTKTGNIYGGVQGGLGFGGGLAATLGWTTPASKTDDVVSGGSFLISGTVARAPKIGPLSANTVSYTSNSSGQALSVGQSTGNSFTIGGQYNFPPLHVPNLSRFFCPALPPGDI